MRLNALMVAVYAAPLLASAKDLGKPTEVPPRIQERVSCSITAAATYEIPANILLAVAEKENGKAGQWVRNSNGSYDVGPLQFNTDYLHELAKHGIAPNHVAAAGCYAFHLAAWRLRKHILNDKGDLWTRAANYHSRTPRFNQVYREDLMVRAAKWADWPAVRYRTHNVPSPGDEPRSAVTSSALTVTSAPAWSSRQYIPRGLVAVDANTLPASR